MEIGATSLSVWFLLLLGMGYVCIFVFMPLVVGTWETFLSGRKGLKFQYSKLCVGRVWHTRFHPKRHSFTYPIFMFALDLQECTAVDGQSLFSILHPLIRFRPHLYHLKNGEGVDPTANATASTGSTSTTTTTWLPLLSQRIFHLIAARTQQRFQPTNDTHRILLLTHLEYYGYNFNPVSFYYILSRTTGEIDAMVGEVSNTPWTEMYCYVLHPDSIDRVQEEPQRQSQPQAEESPLEQRLGSTKDENSRRSNNNNNNNRIDRHSRFYRFPKSFHVSPFMEMDYWYDWTSQDTPLNASSFVVVNSLRRRDARTEDEQEEKDKTNVTSDHHNHEKTKKKERLDFTARLELHTTTALTPYNVAWQVIRFPIFCLLIQVWIHYQAALLFLKGIVYIPHPQGSETAASKAIATLMIPFFALRDYFDKKGWSSSSSVLSSRQQPRRSLEKIE